MLGNSLPYESLSLPPFPCGGLGPLTLACQPVTPGPDFASADAAQKEQGHS
jgi:hypothetical protein